jgi:hypothetical protein
VGKDLPESDDTMAAIDRLVHHSVILEFDGNTYRAENPR